MQDIQRPDKTTLSFLITQLQSGSYMIPSFQRPFEWKPTAVTELLQSILQNYYIGTLLFWKVSNSVQDKLDCKDIEGFIETQNGRTKNFVVLDGQQRLTALYYALAAPAIVYPVKGYKWRYMWYLKTDKLIEAIETENQELFADSVIMRYGSIKWMEFSKNNIEKQLKENIFPIELIHGGKKYFEWLTEFENVNGEHSRQVFEHFIEELVNSFTVSYIELDSELDVPKVCDIFRRLNSKGLPLSVFDLLNAMAVPQGIKLKELFSEAESTITYRLYGKLQMFLLQIMSIIVQEQCSPKYLEYLIPRRVKRVKDHNGTYSKKILFESNDQFINNWTEAVGLIQNAIKYMQSQHSFGIVSERFLPYPNILVVLAVLLKEKNSIQNNKASIDAKLQKWYWATIITQNYSSSVDSKVTKDVLEMREWFTDDQKEPFIISEAKSRLSTLRLQQQGPNSAIYKAIINMLFVDGACDWETFQHLTLIDPEKHNDHHIVPKSWCEKNGINQDDTNSVLNRTILSDETNKNVIKDRLPNVYISEMIAKSNDADITRILESHMVSKHAKEILLRNPFTVSDFQEFLAERERLMRSKMSDVIGITDNIEGMIQPETEFTNQYRLKNAIASCIGEFVWIDKYISTKSLELIAQVVNDATALNFKSIRLLMSIEKVTEAFRKEFLRFKHEMDAKGISSSIHILVDSKIKSAIHDRWIMGDNVVYNVPSADVVARGQYSEIKKTVERPPISEWWDKSLDIIDSWNKVAEIIKES